MQWYCGMDCTLHWEVLEVTISWSDKDMAQHEEAYNTSGRMHPLQLSVVLTLNE